MNNGNLDCVVVGYNETPFEVYETMLSNYGEDSEAYRDLKFSFVDTGEKKLTYPALLSHAYNVSRSNGNGHGVIAGDVFKSGDIPNLAAVYLTNFLRQDGFVVKYINLFQDEKEKFVDYLAQNPLCIALTTTFYVLNFPVKEMVDFIRGHNREVKIVVGGPLIANHIRNNSPQALTAVLEDIGADIYVTDTQGELTLSKITACLKNGGQLDDVPNIIIAEDGGMRRTQTVTENNSLDENYINWLTFPEEKLGHTIQTRTSQQLRHILRGRSKPQTSCITRQLAAC